MVKGTKKVKRRRMETWGERLVREIHERKDAKRGAHRTIAHLIKRGVIKRPERCQECKRPCRAHAHHDDYNKPREVRFLCPRCHRRWHSKHTPKGVSRAVQILLDEDVALEISKISRRYNVRRNRIINVTLRTALADENLTVEL